MDPCLSFYMQIILSILTQVIPLLLTHFPLRIEREKPC